MILKRLKSFQRPRMGGVVDRLAAFRQTALARQPRHQVAKPDGRSAGRFQKIKGDLVGHGLVTPPRGQKPAGRGVGAADQNACRRIAAAAGGHRDRGKGGQRRIVVCLLHLVIKSLHMAFANMAKLMRHHAKEFTRVGGVGQQARMDIDHPLAGDKGVVGRVDDDADPDTARGKAGGLDQRGHQPFQTGLDLAVADHRGRGAAQRKPESGKRRQQHTQIRSENRHGCGTHLCSRPISSCLHHNDGMDVAPARLICYHPPLMFRPH